MGVPSCTIRFACESAKPVPTSSSCVVAAKSPTLLIPILFESSRYFLTSMFLTVLVSMLLKGLVSLFSTIHWKNTAKIRSEAGERQHHNKRYDKYRRTRDMKRSQILNTTLCQIVRSPKYSTFLVLICLCRGPGSICLKD